MSSAALVPQTPVPTVPGWPWTHVLRMREDPISLMREGQALGADVISLRFGFHSAFVLYSPERAHDVLVPGDTLWKGSRGSRLLRRILGPGLLTSEGLVWRDRRRRAQPRFRHESLLKMPAAAQRHADRLVASWAGQSEVDVMAGFSRLALAVVCEVLFGLDPGDDAAVVHEALDEVMSGFLRMMTFPIDGIDRWPLPSSRRHQEAVRALDAVVGRLIERRRAADVEPDLLSDWIAAADAGELTQADLHAEVVTMLLAGHETTANAMSFTSALLATHPEEQVRVTTALETDDAGPLERAFNEGLRLYPPAWAIARAASAPTSVGGAEIPTGAFVFVPIASIHRDPTRWARPDAFEPDRFLQLTPEQKSAFLPFGMGPRRCIGEHFARVEAKVALATVLRHYTLSADTMPKAKASVTLRPEGEVRIRLTPRAV